MNIGNLALPDIAPIY